MSKSTRSLELESAEREEIIRNPVEQNIETVAELHAVAEKNVSRFQHAIESITANLGRPAFLVICLTGIALWVIVNSLLSAHGGRVVDPPPFPWLQGITTVSAFNMTIVVLISQNRQGLRAERRAQLDLQVNLLTEQRTAKLIALVEELRNDLPNVANRTDPEAEMLKQTANPHDVLDALEARLDEVTRETRSVEETVDNVIEIEQNEILPAVAALRPLD